MAEHLTQLEEKMMVDLREGHPYEALQYVQSFVARKKKTLGQDKTSALVFHGARLLIQHDASDDAGTLLAWFIEDGAGVEHLFKLENGALTANNYCDAQRLIELLNSFSALQTFHVVDRVYSPLHILAAKKPESKVGPLAERLRGLEEIFANIFEANSKWNSAYKTVARLGDVPRMARILNSWSAEGHQTEKPLFFARAVLQLLADKKIEKAAELVTNSCEYIDDNVAPGTQLPGNHLTSGSLGVWHLARILSDLASLPPMPRVDKAKLFGLLMQLYIPLVSQIDMKLVEILDKVGPNALGFVHANTQPSPPNPMKLLSNMLAGGPPKPTSGPSSPGFDMNQMMAMLGQMHSLPTPTPTATAGGGGRKK